MLAKGCGSMEHYEHMCSLTLNGCAAEVARFQKDPDYHCSTCGERSHAHNDLCTPSIIGT